jgi:pilus assembly protein Flp/PilA
VLEFCLIMLRIPVPAARRPDQRGASAVEYGLVVAAVVAASVTVVPHMGHVMSTAFHHTCSKDAGTGGTC